MNAEVRTVGQQTYHRIGERPYVTRKGRKTVLLVWSTKCVDCGRDFETTSPLRARKFEPARRCEAHRRPGVRA
jgi:hypothetical protein